MKKKEIFIGLQPLLVAMNTLTGLTYDTLLSAYASKGFTFDKAIHLTDISKLMKATGTKYRTTIKFIPDRKDIDTPTCNQFAFRYERNAYILFTHDHVLACRNGVLKENLRDSTKLRQRVLLAIELSDVDVSRFSEKGQYVDLKRPMKVLSPADGARRKGTKQHQIYSEMVNYVTKHPRISVEKVFSRTDYNERMFNNDIRKGYVTVAA